MGQTLTHGIYLPDEGERNCYSGLAANWQILDNSVGTIAAHTAALSGKAPLVHTHSKADITDFPALATVATSGSYNDLNNIPASFTPASHTHGNLTNDGKVGTTANKPLITGTDGVVQAGSFGNTANTFCEGNDSRLSDARTPVAHTHTKSDVTDLLNSNFIPSANNSYDLGSSSYQWNNLYAKSYFYNGTAWGLDKVNTWSANNSFYDITIYGKQTNTFQSNSSVGEKGDASVFALNIQVQDKNHAGWSSSGVANIGMGQDNNGSYISFGLDTKDSNDTRRNSSVSFLLKPTDNSNNAYFFPNRDNTVDLGTSTNKWKTFNGINPGALSLPSEDASSVNLDPTNWNLTGTSPNYYTPPANGWLGVQVISADTTDLTEQFLFAGRATGGVNYYPEGGTTSINVNSGQGTLMGQVFIPVISGKLYHIRVKIGVDLTHGSSITARFYPCLGNV